MSRIKYILEGRPSLSKEDVLKHLTKLKEILEKAKLASQDNREQKLKWYELLSDPKPHVKAIEKFMNSFDLKGFPDDQVDDLYLLWNHSPNHSRHAYQDELLSEFRIKEGIKAIDEMTNFIEAIYAWNTPK